MAKIKLTKMVVEAAKPRAPAVELRDTIVPGFLYKITPAGRRVFMLQYRGDVHALCPHAGQSCVRSRRTGSRQAVWPAIVNSDVPSF